MSTPKFGREADARTNERTTRRASLINEGVERRTPTEKDDSRLNSPRNSSGAALTSVKLAADSLSYGTCAAFKDALLVLSYFVVPPPVLLLLPQSTNSRLVILG